MKRKNTRESRVWRANVIRRDKCCILCSSRQNRQAHHMDDYSYHPKGRYLVENGVTLCRKCHTTYHCDYNRSFRVKTTKKNFLEFIKVVNYINSLSGIKEEIILEKIIKK